MTGLTADQVGPLLDAFTSNHWMLADMIVTGDAKRAVGSCYGSGGRTRYVKFTKTGIHYGTSVAGPHEVIRWTAVLATINALPSSAREAVAVAEERCRESQRAFRIFTAPAHACGCGPLPKIGPLTAQQQAYADAYDDYETTVHEPWLANDKEVKAARLAAIQACFQDAADDLLSYAATLFD